MYKNFVFAALAALLMLPLPALAQQAGETETILLRTPNALEQPPIHYLLPGAVHHLPSCTLPLAVGKECEALHIRGTSRAELATQLTQTLATLGFFHPDTRTLVEAFLADLWLRQKDYPGAKAEMVITINAVVHPFNLAVSSSGIKPDGVHPVGKQVATTSVRLRGTLAVGGYILHRHGPQSELVVYPVISIVSRES